MRLRLFRAARMSDAMAQLRAELGPEAVILSTRRVADGVEVSAALDSAEPLLILPGGPAVSERPDPLLRHNLPAGLLALFAGLPLADALAEHLDFARLPDGGARPLLLCGPPGVGKTLSCAKLAARGVMAGASPLVITTDGARAGAIEQLAAFTRVLGVTLAVAPGPGTLGKAIARRTDQPVLIDTAGIDPGDPAAAAELRALIETAGATPVLVLSAGLDAADAADLAAGFRDLGTLHVLPTKLDLPRRLGSVLAAAAAGLALTEAGIGPDAANGLIPITPAWLAERLLAGPPERHA